MKVLVLFSNPPDAPRIKLDHEDKIFFHLQHKYSNHDVIVERHPASAVDDVNNLLKHSYYDVIHFSGHGSPDGIYLDKNSINASNGELVSAKRLLSIFDLAEKPPKLVTLLCCYSDEHTELLIETAPFVITAFEKVNDDACLVFTEGFYDRLFSGHAIQSSFDHALSLLRAKGMPHHAFRISRRALINQGNSILIQSTPTNTKDSILINLDGVRDRLDKLGFDYDELLHYLARKITIHGWIFDQPRDGALIPIGKLLFGEFRWSDSKDVVYCTRLMRLQADYSQTRWTMWCRLLLSYNDLASSEHRSPDNPGGPTRRQVLGRALGLFTYHCKRYIAPIRSTIADMRETSILPHLELTIAHIEAAEDQFHLERYPQVVEYLEQALTNYHEIVTALQPPEATDL